MSAGSVARTDDRQTSFGCRPGCGACCIAPSISSPMPKMPFGKKAGERCLHLLPDWRCELFGRPERPEVCASLRPSPGMCGANRDEALRILDELEAATAPTQSRRGPV